jgi:hypothetical protein
VLAAIALDVDAQDGPVLTRRDLAIERASAAAGIRLLRWQARALPDQAQIQAALGEPLTQFLEEVPSIANHSWWPPLATSRQDPSHH